MRTDIKHRIFGELSRYGADRNFECSDIIYVGHRTTGFFQLRHDGESVEILSYYDGLPKELVDDMKKALQEWNTDTMDAMYDFELTQLAAELFEFLLEVSRGRDMAPGKKSISRFCGRGK